MSPSQESADTSGQFVAIERLDDIVVGARFQASNPLTHRCETAQDQDRGPVPGGAQGSDELQGIGPWLRDIEKNGGKGNGRQRKMRFVRVGYMVQVKPCLRHDPPQ